MAARGLLMPFHIHNRRGGVHNRAAAPVVTFISWVGTRSRATRARFFCSQIDLSKYREKFAQKMAMAGLKPHHRVAIAVSGGPDSIALCLLTADWKSDNFDATTKGRSKSVDGLLAIIVDHGLRTESADEANLVCRRVLDMGIKCEVARCEWLDGRPKIGHLQEAARNKRYDTLQRICFQQQIGILLIAHHADDQAELFILRLSRNSGVLGLAGMAFASQVFSEFPDFSGEESKAHGILLVRPLLEFSKGDMYNICQGGNQQWVEDPTNRSPLYVRNRIRISLNNLSSSVFKAELQAVIQACRRTRMHVEKLCHLLLIQTVTTMPHGYAVIDLGILDSMKVKDIYLAKFATVVVQFISQRHRPVRGSGLKLLLSYLRTFPCKTCLTVAGCYLCPAPGSKGTKVLVCCSVDPSSPPVIKLCQVHSIRGPDGSATSELEQIVMKIEANMDKFVPNASSVPFLDATPSESVLIEAKRLGILSDSSHETIVSLQKQESENFRSTAEAVSDSVLKDNIRYSGTTLSNLIYPRQLGYFMNRFLLDWKVCDAMDCASSMNKFVSVNELVAEDQCFCSSCIIGDHMVAKVRQMIDADWLYLYDLSKKINMVDSQPENCPSLKMKQLSGITVDYAILSASRALASLKSIPIAARRSMPVLVNSKGVLLSIPSIGFSHCPHLMVSAFFHPRIPLGGGHGSFL